MGYEDQVKLRAVALSCIRSIQSDPASLRNYQALYTVCQNMDNGRDKWEATDALKKACAERIRGPVEDREEIGRIFRGTLLLEAQGLRFDSYMQYIELNREPEKRFWIPRREQLMPVCRAMQRLIDDELDILSISLPPGTGKALADSTPVLTKNGWTTHGALKVGDCVVSPSGRFVEVLAVHPKCEMQYAVSFTNGERIICHGNHEWYVYNRHRLKCETLSTEYIYNSRIESGDAGKRGHRYFYQLPTKHPLDCIDKELYVDPYTLGAWLGDGRNTNPDICGDRNDRAIAEKISKHYEMSWHTTHATTGVEYYGFKTLRADLQRYGMCHSRRRVDKYIPDAYYIASKAKRLELLAGLLDTDGCKLPDKNGYRFSTAEETLKDSFVRLIATFGWRTSVSHSEPCTSSSGISGRKGYYTISFMPTEYIPCVLPRKQLKQFSKPRMIAISGIEKISGFQGNCITVEGGLYCVGNTLLPTHNSTLEIFLHSMSIGAFGDQPSLASGHSGTLTNSIYTGVLSIITDKDEYLWRDVFPNAGEIITNAKEQTIDVGKKHRFSSLTCRAIGASLTGATRCERLLTADDLVSGIEEALSVDRLEKLWTEYTNDLKSRKKLDCKELHLATRWSVHDPIGRLRTMYDGNPRAMFLVIPALDEDGHSNFNYKYRLGFDEQYFSDMKDNLDEASFLALFQNEPIEREGLLYDRDTLRRYFELPPQEPDAVLAVCDTKDKGSDYCVLPILFQYGNDFYVEDILCDNSLPELVEEKIVTILLKYKVKMARFESNSAGGKIAEKVQEEVKKKGGITHITTKYSTANKETRIIVDSPFVKEHFLFKDDASLKDRPEYRKALQMLCSYTVARKNPHDDVPDAFSMSADFVQSFYAKEARVIQRPF